MFNRRFLAEAAVLVLVAILVAAASNAFAERHRKLAWKANYPNAMTVTRRPAFVPAETTTLPMTAGTTEADVLPRTLDPGAAESEDVSSPATTTTSSPSPAAAAAPPTPTPPATPTPAPRPPKVFAAAPDRPFVEITPQDAQELHGRRALFIDARRTSEYEAGHIAGARVMAVWEADVDQRVAALYEEGRNQQDPVVIYCSGGNCEDSHMLAQKLWGVGFDNVLVYRDGYPDWVKRGGAVAKGPNP